METVRQQGMRRRLSVKNLATMGFLGIERKFYDTSLTGGVLTAPTDATGGEFDPSATSMITTPTVGDGEQQRDGKQIAMLYIDINGVIQTVELAGVANSPPTLQIFVAIVLDTQSNGAQMNSEDCFKNTTAGAQVAPNPLRNLLFGKRFRILKSHNFILQPMNTCVLAGPLFTTGAMRRNFHWFIPLKGLKVNFNAGTTASIANVIDNSVHVIAYTNSVTGTPTISYNARLRFVG